MNPRFHWWRAAAITVMLSTASLVVSSLPAPASQQHDVVVSATPTKYTPNVEDGTVYTIAQVGSRIYLGGDFTTVTSRGASSTVARQSILAFNSTNGVVDASFVPTLDGTVNQIIPGPDNSVYVVGSFKTVNGVAMRVARLDAVTGALVSGWAPPTINSATTTIAFSGSTLYVGGTFTKVAGATRGGFVALDAKTGARRTWFPVTVAGSHGTGTATGAIGPKRMDITPDGRQLAVVGNFTSATDAGGTVDRDQVMLIDIVEGTSAIVDRDWRTLAYSAQCANWAFASTVRDVQYSPDGSWFAIATTGGGRGTNIDGTKSLCDTAARWESNSTGSNVQPTWIASTGGDSLWSVAITGSAVYVGGHQRWMNNDNGVDFAGAGAVPRPGITALDPLSGVPLTWNPGRNPRGAGVYAILATPTMLYLGSDTEWIGDYRYKRERIAGFPIAGGTALPAGVVGSLPGTIYAAGSLAPGTSGLVGRTLDTAGAAGAAQQVDATTLDWNAVRGAFLVDGVLFYGLSDGTFHRRTFDGTTLGADTVLDPYNDPAWSTVGTGRSGQYYRGVVPGLYGKLSTVTSMFYDRGRIYYTMSDRTGMYSRAFSPESGIIGALETTVPGGLTWSNIAGAFVAGSSLYYVSSTDGVLRQYAWATGQPSGSPTVVNSATNWSARSLFVRSS
ncbi:MAG: hypothetical protein ACRCTR_07630 [Actinomycetota bacterium]